ncbi:MAG: helix-turn-helix domain containing protein [Lachnospiraceae bacterium]|nr:helix-turn-helix domain containing protein [Lachnospiraceae bacterium]
MTKKYDVELKKQLVHAYMQGAGYSQLEKEYDVAKPTIYRWVKKYNEECKYTSKS